MIHVHPCVCCKELTEEPTMSRDEDLEGMVCEPCRKELRNAKAVLAMPFAPSGDRISIKGVCKDAEAGDNL